MSLVDLFPANNTTGVNRSLAALTARFSRPLSTPTVGTPSFTLTDAQTGQAIGAAVGVVGTSTASLTPMLNPLRMLTRYRVRLASSITGTGSETFAGSDTTFTTRDGAWDATPLPASGAAENQNPVVGVDGAGNAIVVYRKVLGSGAPFATPTAVANHYSASTNSWASAAGTPLQANAAGWLFRSVRLAINPAGSAVAVWARFQVGGLGRTQIWVNRSSTATPGAWGTAQRIDTAAAGDADSPAVAMDASGNAVVVWRHLDAGGMVLRSSRLNAATGAWSTPVPIDNAPGAINQGDVAMDAAGNAIAVWDKFDGTRYNVWANRFSATSGTWGTPLLLETNSAGSAIVPRVAMNAAGDAGVVWIQGLGGASTQVWTNRFSTASGTWAGVSPIPNTTGMPVNSPQAGIDRAGNLVAIWREQQNLTFTVHASRRNAATGFWSAARKLGGDFATAVTTDFAQIAVDPAGNAIAVWMEGPTATSVVRTARYTQSNDTWIASTSINPQPAPPEQAPTVAVDAEGRAMATWLQVEGNDWRVMANRFR